MRNDQNLRNAHLPLLRLCYEQIKGREDEFLYINIGENSRNLSAFMRLRDKSPVFDHCREIGDVGVPAFVFEDGRISIDPADAGLIESVTLAHWAAALAAKMRKKQTSSL